MKSTETRGTPFRIFVALSAASVLGAGLVSMGLLDRLSGAGGVPVPLALSTIAIYWVLISLALYLYHRFMTERKALLYLLANIAVSLIVAEVVLLGGSLLMAVVTRRVNGGHGRLAAIQHPLPRSWREPNALPPVAQEAVVVVHRARPSRAGRSRTPRSPPAWSWRRG